MFRRIFLGSALIASTLGAVDVTITWNQWPYGVRYIGSYTKWNMSADGSHVTVPEFNPDDTVWDLVNLGGSAVSRNAESDIRPKSEAQGLPPAFASYAEKQIFSGQTSWGYEHMDTTGSNQYMWLYGFYAQGTQVDYDPPYNMVYQFPARVGDQWQNVWTWNYQGIDEVTETRNNYYVAEGWVRVPADSFHYYPCIVMRTYSTSVDELGAINENRIIHEWIVPDMGRVGGSVASIQSQNNETNPGFTDAEHVFRQKEFHSIFDNQPPAFANTTRILSGYNLGPFFVSSSITDASGVRRDSIFYRIGAGAWQSAAHDSVRGNIYSFHIPELTGADTVRYYLAASDTAPGHNRGTDPVEGAASPFWFYARDPADDHYPPVISGTTVYNDTAFAGPFLVAANVVDSCSVDSVTLVYRFNSQLETILSPDSIRGAVYYMTIPSAAMNTFIRYKVRAVDGSPNHNGAYDPPSGYYSFNILDNSGPAFANTTQLPDTDFGGPFYVSSTITDSSGVQRAAIFFKLGSLGWDSLSSDSSSSGLWSFHIPQVTSPMSIRYYLKAADNSQTHNTATDPVNAPTTYYLFYCSTSGIEADPGLPAGLSLDMMAVNPGRLELALPNQMAVNISLYDAKGGRVRRLYAGDKATGRWTFEVPSKLANGCYLLDVVCGTWHLRRNFVVTR